MSTALPLLDDELNAFVDRQLPRQRAEAVAAELQRDAALAAWVGEMRRQNARLRDAFDLWLAEPMPPELVAAAASGGASLARRWRPVAFSAAAALLLGVALGWFGRDQVLQLAGTPLTFPRQAALTHALYADDANRPVELWAAEEQHLVSWLSKRLGFTLHAPDLNSVGFALVGGRLVAGNEKPGALFMYQNAEQQRVSLLVRRDSEPSRETAFRYAVEDGVGVFYWIDDACGYALSGSISRGQLLAIARVVYVQLASLEASAKP